MQPHANPVSQALAGIGGNPWSGGGGSAPGTHSDHSLQVSANCDCKAEPTIKRGDPCGSTGTVGTVTPWRLNSTENGCYYEVECEGDGRCDCYADNPNWYGAGDAGNGCATRGGPTLPRVIACSWSGSDALPCKCTILCNDGTAVPVATAVNGWSACDEGRTDWELKVATPCEGFDVVGTLVDGIAFGAAFGGAVGSVFGPEGTVAGGYEGAELGLLFSLLEVAENIAENSTIDWAPPDESMARPYTCTAKCNLQQVDRSICCPGTVSAGPVSASSELEACAAAKRLATQSAPSGCDPRHCKCDCWR